MAFSEQILRAQYDTLGTLVVVEQQGLWATQQETIIALCIDNEIPLYNIAAVKVSEASKLLSRLIALSAKYDELDELDKNNEEWRQQFLAWQETFTLELQKARLALITQHDKAYLSVADQYQKRDGKISEQTLLTMKDMTDLLANPEFNSEDVVKSKPFSLVEMSIDEEEEISALLEDNKDNEKTIFLAANYDGHWFHILRKNGCWSVRDEQPFEKGEHGELFLTPRQAGMLEKSTLLLNNFLGEGSYEVEGSHGLAVFSTQEQDNNVDCGTRVVNAYRKQVDETYEAREHRDMLVETLEKQLPYEQLPEQLFSEDIEFNEKVDYIIETTIAAGDSKHAKFGDYKTLVKNTVEAVVNRQGLFANVQNKIAVEDIDLAAAEVDEEDEDFAARLQEAECRKAGL